jgi:hypothetical protein
MPLRPFTGSNRPFGVQARGFRRLPLNPYKRSDRPASLEMREQLIIIARPLVADQLAVPASRLSSRIPRK